MTANFHHYLAFAHAMRCQAIANGMQPCFFWLGHDAVEAMREWVKQQAFWSGSPEEFQIHGGFEGALDGLPWRTMSAEGIALTSARGGELAKII